MRGPYRNVSLCLMGKPTLSLTEYSLTHLLSKGIEKDEGMLSLLSQIYTTVMHVPERIQAICWVQFWSWIGWFPILFYGSTWVGEIYLRYEAPETTQSKDALNEVGRHGE